MTALVNQSLPIRIVVSLLSLLVVLWVLVMPATWMVGSFQGHTERIRNLWRSDSVPVPRDILTKWAPHSFVRFSHILPSAGWAACVACQVHGPGRSSAMRWLHRASGRAMLVFSIMIAVGYVVLDHSGLSSNKGSLLGQRASAAWFVTTAVFTGLSAMSARAAVLSGNAAELRQSKERHAGWAFRHMTSGLWIMVMRILVFLTGAWLRFRSMRFDSEKEQVQLFLDLGAGSWFVSVVGGEIWLRLAHEKPRLRPTSDPIKDHMS